MKIKEKVLLIQPNYQVKSDAVNWECNPPLGLCYLGAVLEKENIPVEILDANVKNLSASQATSIIKRKSPRYIGFGILTPAVEWCETVIKKLSYPIVKIAGGPHPSALPVDILKSGFDICVIGEGEETLAEIVKGKKLAGIKGIFYRKGKKIFQNPPRLPLDPNKLPLPARHLLEKGGTNKPYLSSGTRYFPWSPIITSRGCPFNCYFCNKNIFGYQFRARTPENVLEEIDFLVSKYKVREIDFYDDIFNFDIKRAEKIMDLIAQRGYKLHLRFSNGIRADKVTKRLLKKMKQAGTGYIAYGIESGDPKILSLIPKSEKISQIRKAVRLTKEVGIEVTGFFIIGLIGDTKKTMQRTIDFAKSLDLDKVIINIAGPYPGTRMWQMIKEMKGKIFLKKWQDFHHGEGKALYSLPGMATPEEVEEMYRKAYRSFYFRPSFLIRQVPKLFSLSFLPIAYRGLQRILYSQKAKENLLTGGRGLPPVDNGGEK